MDGKSVEPPHSLQTPNTAPVSHHHVGGHGPGDDTTEGAHRWMTRRVVGHRHVTGGRHSRRRRHDPMTRPQSIPSGTTTGCGESPHHCGCPCRGSSSTWGQPRTACGSPAVGSRPSSRSSRRPRASSFPSTPSSSPAPHRDRQPSVQCLEWRRVSPSLERSDDHGSERHRTALGLTIIDSW